MKKIDEIRFCDEKEIDYRNKVLKILNYLSAKGISSGLNEEEELLRREINTIVNKFYFGR